MYTLQDTNIMMLYLCGVESKLDWEKIDILVSK